MAVIGITHQSEFPSVYCLTFDMMQLHLLMEVTLLHQQWFCDVTRAE